MACEEQQLAVMQSATEDVARRPAKRCVARDALDDVEAGQFIEACASDDSKHPVHSSGRTASVAA
jgi:hypothetical protein